MSITPVVFETTSSGERAYDIFSYLQRQRTIFLKDPIEDDVANIIAAQLTFLDAKDRRKPIDLYINSPGGVVTDLLAMYDSIQFISAPVRTLCIGQACSAAAVLLCAGAEGRRAALPHSRIMIHQPRGRASGTVTDQEIALRESVRLKHIVNEIVARHTKQPLSVVADVMERDKWMSAGEALEFGIIDEILTSRNYSDYYYSDPSDDE